MRNFAFISLNQPTETQHALADAKGITLTHVGDMDAFTVNPEDMPDGTDGVVVVHPAMALRLCMRYPIGVFENAMRDGTFEAKALHLFARMVA